jgi:hypothetical protein
VRTSGENRLEEKNEDRRWIRRNVEEKRREEWRG